MNLTQPHQTNYLDINVSMNSANPKWMDGGGLATQCHIFAMVLAITLDLHILGARALHQHNTNSILCIMKQQNKGMKPAQTT